MVEQFDLKESPLLVKTCIHIVKVNKIFSCNENCMLIVTLDVCVTST
jgi:hypothetical protein